jgi:hypothetical protein
MFCPNCGRDNTLERRFCASCGTNLEVVSQALSGDKDDFFTKIDAGLDQFTARYVEHIFKDAPSNVNDRKVSNSWKLLGQGILTSFVDVFLFFLMWNIMPLRFLILLISTPFRLLGRRGSKEAGTKIKLEGKRAELPGSYSDNWLQGPVASVSENTTERLEEYGRSKQKQANEGQ